MQSLASTRGMPKHGRTWPSDDPPLSSTHEELSCTGIAFGNNEQQQYVCAKFKDRSGCSCAQIVWSLRRHSHHRTSRVSERYPLSERIKCHVAVSVIASRAKALVRRIDGAVCIQSLLLLSASRGLFFRRPVACEKLPRSHIRSYSHPYAHFFATLR